MKRVLGYAGAIAAILAAFLWLGVHQSVRGSQAQGFIGGGFVPSTGNNSGRIVGPWFFSSEQSYSTTGTSSDIALSASASVFRYTGASTATFTGFAGGTTGRTVVGRNESSSNVTLPHNVTSTAANRLSLPTSVDWTCLPGGSWSMMYVAGSTNRWLVFPGSACFSSTHPMLAAAAANGESPQWDATAWQSRTPNDYRGTHLEWVDEWTLNSCSSATTCGNGLYTALNSGAATGIIGLGSGGVRPGFISLATGTTTTGRTGLFTGQGFDFGTTTTSVSEAVLGFPTLSTALEEFSFVVGFGDATSANQTDGCYFLYDRGNVAAGGCNTGNADKWEAVCSQASTRTIVLLDGSSQNGACAAGSITTVNSAISIFTLPVTNITHLKIVVTSNTSAVFSINGSTVATLTTNIPSTTANSTGAVINILKSAGTTSRSVSIDWTRTALDLAAVRSP